MKAISERPSSDLGSQEEKFQKKHKPLTVLGTTSLGGALGGAAKVTWDAINPKTFLSVSTNSTVSPSSNVGPSSSLLLGGSIFLGAISACIGSVIFSDLISLDKSKVKIFGYALAFGLFFPAVFEMTAKTINLETKNQELKVEKQQIAEKAINELEQLGTSSKSAETQVEALKSIGTLAESSDSPQVEKTAIKSVKSISTQTSEANNDKIQKEAIMQISDLGVKSKDKNIQEEASQTLGTIAENSENRDVKELAENKMQQLNKNQE